MEEDDEDLIVRVVKKGAKKNSLEMKDFEKDMEKFVKEINEVRARHGQNSAVHKKQKSK
jgi:soluble cytochrome b562